MTVYELIKKLTEFEPDEKVKVVIYGKPEDIKEYYDKGVDGRYNKMWIKGTIDTVDTVEYENKYSVEIACDLERL